MAFKDKALKRMTEKFAKAGVTWGLGAGWLMDQLGVAEGFHDFDVFTAYEDAEKADKVLSRLGMKSDMEQAEDHFRCSYHFDGADVDLCAGLAVVYEGTEYHLRFGSSSVMGMAPIPGGEAPMMYPEDWLILYTLMGRTAKADQLKAWFADHPSQHPERLNLTVQEELPAELAASLQEALNIKAD